MKEKAFIDRSFVYIIATLSAFAVYMNSLKQDSFVSLSFDQVGEILLDIGYRGIWTWGFETFSIESRWARWTILILYLSLSIWVAFRLNYIIKQFDKKMYGEDVPSAEETP